MRHRTEPSQKDRYACCGRERMTMQRFWNWFIHWRGAPMTIFVIAFALIVVWVKYT